MVKIYSTRKTFAEKEKEERVSSPSHSDRFEKQRVSFKAPDADTPRDNIN